jgi:hypothetical protein
MLLYSFCIDCRTTLLHLEQNSVWRRTANSLQPLSIQFNIVVVTQKLHNIKCGYVAFVICDLYSPCNQTIEEVQILSLYWELLK